MKFTFTQRIKLVWLICLLPTSLMAQDKLTGGAGGFTVGGTMHDVSALNTFLPESLGSLNDNSFQIGGEGYGVYQNWMLGASGYYTQGDRKESAGMSYMVNGGAAFINFGYVAVQQEKFIAYPRIGIGYASLGVEEQVDGQVQYPNDQLLEADYDQRSPLLDLGAGLDFLPFEKEGYSLMLGLRAGYKVALNDGEWFHSGGELVGEDLPEFEMDGFYLSLTLGGAGFMNR